MTILKNKVIILLVGLVSIISGLNGAQRRVRFQQETPLQEVVNGVKSIGTGLKTIGSGLVSLPFYSIKGGMGLVKDINAQFGYAPMFITTLAVFNSFMHGLDCTSSDPRSLMFHTSKSLHDLTKALMGQVLMHSGLTACLCAGFVGVGGYVYKSNRRPWYLSSAGSIRATIGFVGTLATVAGLGAMSMLGVPAVAQPVVQAS